ncbi:hypothetical protein M404DRAFT_1006167, partial [Pisolithus tinctorius Marx 270]
MADNLEGQSRLSEQLQLLDQFGYSNIERFVGVGQHSNKNMRNRTIRILETIAAALTTGNPGEVFAAAFDSRNTLTLVLAKNDCVTDEDNRAVRRLFNAITAPETQDAYDVLPFLLSRCGRNMEKRVTKMHDAVTAFSHDLDMVLRDYQPLDSIEDEFPKSEVYREKKYGGKRISSTQMMRDLLADITRTARDFNSQSLSAKDLYEDLAVYIPILKRSRLLRSLSEATDSMDLDRELELERLKHRLEKVSQYYYGINSLIRYARRYFPQGINHRWVGAISGTGGTTIVLDDDYLEAVSRALGSRPSEDTLATLRTEFPKVEEMWRSRRSVKTKLHAEIQIVLDLSSPLDTLDHEHQQSIGCGKRSCLCCTLWIRAYNRTFDTQWLTSASHGGADATWAFTGCSYARAKVEGKRSAIDKAVMRGVETRLSNTLDSLFPDQGRPSDEADSESEMWWSSGAASRVMSRARGKYEDDVS